MKIKRIRINEKISYDLYTLDEILKELIQTSPNRNRLGI